MGRMLMATAVLILGTIIALILSAALWVGMVVALVTNLLFGWPRRPISAGSAQPRC
jgi:hypothetical protein